MTIQTSKRTPWMPPWLQAYLIMGQGLALCLGAMLFKDPNLSLFTALAFIPLLLLTAYIRLKTPARLRLAIGDQVSKPAPLRCDNHALWAVPMMIALQIVMVLSLHFANCRTTVATPTGDLVQVCEKTAGSKEQSEGN